MRKRNAEPDGSSPRRGATLQGGADQPLDHAAAADTDAVPVSAHGRAVLVVAAPRHDATPRSIAVTFFLVLIASLLMLEARRTYVFEAATAQAGDGTVGVPPM